MSNMVHVLLGGIGAVIMVIALLYLSDLDRKTEDMDKLSEQSIENKINLLQSGDNVEYSEEIIRLTGAEVFAEISKQDGSVSIRVNNEHLNSISNIEESEKDFFEYIAEYGTDLIREKVSLTADYVKTYIIDENGKITEIRYQVYT